MKSKQQTAVEWLLENMPEDYLNSIPYELAEQAIKMQREQHGKTWDFALDAGQNRAWNVMRAYDDFDDYYNQTYKGGEQ